MGRTSTENLIVVDGEANAPCHGKGHLIANQNAITYKEIFKLIRKNKIWLGYTNPVAFRVPDDYEMRGVRSRQWQRQPLPVPSLTRFAGVGLLSP